jgi:hypothetical protein
MTFNFVEKHKKIIKLFPARESLVSDIPAGDGKIASFLTMYRKVSCEYLHLVLLCPECMVFENNMFIYKQEMKL